MSKLIKMTPELLEQCKEEFAVALSTGKFADGKVNFTKTLGSVDRKATVFFSELAWLKMQTLIREFDKEVAWHGVAFRGEDETKDEYYITDILVYPQEVTGATVTTDQEKYQMWLMEHDDDVFNNIRFQGHSHVNMAVSPSGVDLSLYERLLDQLDDSMFYIFMIWNKRKDKHVKIYDLKKNVLFETTDVTVEVMEDGTGIEQFLKDAKEMVKSKPVTPTYSYGNGYGGYNGYGGGNYGANKGQSQYGNYSQPSGVSKKEENKPGKHQALTDKENKKNGKRRKGRRDKNAKNCKGQMKFPVQNYCDPGYDEDDYYDDDYYERLYGRGY